jgi:hypothetical protein
MPFFSVQGAWRDLISYIMQYGTRHPLTSNTYASMSFVVKSAESCSLKTEIDGVPYLRSQNEYFYTRNLISWAEAECFVNAMQENEEVISIQNPDDFVVGNIPVFSGRISVNYGVCALTRTTTVNIDAIQIIQTADCRAYCFLSDPKDKNKTVQSVLCYETYFVNPPTSLELRNNT